MRGTTDKDRPPPKEKAAVAGRPSEVNQSQADITHDKEKRKFCRHQLNLALVAVFEAECGDLSLVQLNPVEAATEMLAVAAKVRRALRQ
jgi:hypothetical protein